MKPSRDEVLQHFLGILHSLGEEYEDSVASSEDTQILNDLNWRSVEIVYIANEVQKHYDQIFPFEKLIQEIESRGNPEVTVADWVNFIHRHLDASAVS